jgi:uncharacterized protein YlzI (FlbEa/FlbD family)
MPQVHFHDIRHIIIEHLSRSTQQVEVAVAWFTDESIFNILLDLLRRGVQVSVVITQHSINGQANLDWLEFKKLGGKAFAYGDSYKTMHNKFCIIDREVIINGSYNWTNRAASSNKENINIFFPEDGLKADKFVEEFHGLISQSIPLVDVNNRSILVEDEKIHVIAQSENLNKSLDDGKKIVVEDSVELLKSNFLSSKREYESLLDSSDIRVNHIDSCLIAKSLIKLMLNTGDQVYNQKCTNIDPVYIEVSSVIDFIYLHYTEIEEVKQICLNMYNKIDNIDKEFIRYKAYQCFDTYGMWNFEINYQKNFFGQKKYPKYNNEFEFIINTVFNVFSTARRLFANGLYEIEPKTEIRINRLSHIYVVNEHSYFKINKTDPLFSFKKDGYKHYFR